MTTLFHLDSSSESKNKRVHAVLNQQRSVIVQLVLANEEFGNDSSAFLKERQPSVGTCRLIWLVRSARE